MRFCFFVIFIMSASFEYGAVARKDTILAQYAAVGGNFDVISAEILKKLNQKDSKFALEKDNHKFFIQHEENNLNYIIVGSLSLQLQKANDVLSKINKSFISKFGNKWQESRPYGLQNEFSEEIKRLMTEYKLSEIHHNLNETQDVMTDSLKKAMLRGQELEELELSSTAIELGSREYSTNVRSLKCKNICLKYWIYFIVAMVLFTILFIIGFSIYLKKIKS
ncbi:Vesicle-associated membrane protein 7 [Tritrichomonas foetus]|uniref:Vesicle-associated membrane protein 7 n=1 Tax=Tritrichomonas foetus TaxID=1144522 RepID=A0A1J4JGU1_9EUKA|nr:Vesicle-associated membrane protein 7 [Tritrichomonas foetus]|eukprot:OHS98370.1 Vesicle-associated membrane protein 7 [Tritrichomonas foetus]